jgi:hypothetical protein
MTYKIRRCTGTEENRKCRAYTGWANLNFSLVDAYIVRRYVLIGSCCLLFNCTETYERLL